ncbi:MAG TPA: MATE family efflux transporter [Clostridia bacterium]|nr:MATE family efflux transporter [Clostridia bacterium]
MNNNRDLTQGSLGRQLVRMTGPMIFGILGITIFNLVDTFFVGLLGTRELAALSFTFPIVLTFHSLTMGVSTGVTAMISRAAGRNEPEKLKAQVFDSIIIAIIMTILFIGIGFVIMKPVLILMKAEEDLLPIILTYLYIWLPGLIFVIFPMVGNGIIRALGDTKTPGVVMMIAALVNAVLDPMFIFGIGPFPELGVAGAALATVIGRFVTFAIALYVLVKREKVLTLMKRKPREMLATWKEIFMIAIPAALSRIILPIGTGIITGLLAAYGLSAVAGFGVAAKLENFLLIITNALASVIVPIAGQNIGARKFDRVREIYRKSNLSTLSIQGGLFIVILFAAPLLAGIFSDDPEVIRIAATYLRIVAIAYGMKGMIMLGAEMLNVMRRPLLSAALNIGQMFVLFIPLAWIGSSLFEINGIFIALALSLLIGAFAARGITRRAINGLEQSLMGREAVNEGTD